MSLLAQTQIYQTPGNQTTELLRLEVRAWVKWGGTIVILSFYQNMIQRCAKQDTKKKLSPKDALDIVKGVYKGMKDLSFFSMYPRTLDQRPANVNFRTHLDDITPSNFGEEEKVSVGNHVTGLQLVRGPTSARLRSASSRQMESCRTDWFMYI
jgi:hypothetical protein